MRLRIVFPESLHPHRGMRLLEKALAHPLLDEDRALAVEQAAEGRAEFTGVMERMLPQYEESRGALDELIRGSRGAKRAEWMAKRTKLHTRTDWLLRAEFNVRYRQQFLLGKQMGGNGRPVQRNEKEILRRLVNNEMEYARNALLDAETGEYTMAFDRRGTLYGNALDEAKWLGFCYADLSQDRYVQWVLEEGATEGVVDDCIDCVWLAGRMDILQAKLMAQAATHGGRLPPAAARLWRILQTARKTAGGRWGVGVYRVQELVRMGVFPQSARLACTTNCKCHLEEVERPAGKPLRREARGWASLAPKRPTMLNRTTAVEERERLARLAGGWEHEHIRRRKTKPKG